MNISWYPLKISQKYRLFVDTLHYAPPYLSFIRSLGWNTCNSLQIEKLHAYSIWRYIHGLVFSVQLDDFAQLITPACAINSKPAFLLWTMWWQGLDDAPSVIQLCVASMEKLSGFPVVVIDRHNISEFLSINKQLLLDLDTGKMPLALFSDMVRFSLLYHYGGLWVDSTVYVTEALFPAWGKQSIITLSHQISQPYVSRGCWTSWLFGGQKHEPFFLFVYSILLAVYSRSKQYEYMLIDYVIHYILSSPFSMIAPLDQQKIIYSPTALHSSLVTGESPLQHMYPINKLSWKQSVYSGPFDLLNSL
jgi:hypothetical protein